MSDQEEKIILDAPVSTDKPVTVSPQLASIASGLSRAWLFTIAALLTVLALGLIFIVVPGKTTEIQKRGVKAEGQVLMKDSQTVDGSTAYIVRFVYTDAHRVNHDGMNQLADAGQWQGLKPNQYINVYYLPDRPDQAYMEGAIGMVAAHSRSLSFLGWTALIVSIPVWYVAFKAPRAARKAPRPRGPVVTRR